MGNAGRRPARSIRGLTQEAIGTHSSQSRDRYVFRFQTTSPPGLRREIILQAR